MPTHTSPQPKDHTENLLSAVRLIKDAALFEKGYYLHDTTPKGAVTIEAAAPGLPTVSMRIYQTPSTLTSSGTVVSSVLYTRFSLSRLDVSTTLYLGSAFDDPSTPAPLLGADTFADLLNELYAKLTH